MQATVLSTSPEGAMLVTDEGRRLRVTAEVVQRSGLRLLRPGQRLHAVLSRGGEVDQIGISDPREQ